MVGGTIGSLRKELYDSLLAKPAEEQEAAAKSEFPSKPWNPPAEAPPLGRRRGMYAPRRSQQQQQEAAARAIQAQKQQESATAAAAAAAAGTAATGMDAADAGAPDAAVVGDDNKGGGNMEGAPAEDDVRSTSPIDTTAAAPAAPAHSPVAVASVLAFPMTRRQQQQQQAEKQQQRSTLAVQSPTSEAVPLPPPPLPPPLPPPEPPMIPPVLPPPPLSHMRVNAALHALYIVLAAAASPAGLAATRAGEGGAPYAGTLDGASLLALAVHTPHAQNAPGGPLDVPTLEAVLRAAANRLVGNVIIRAVEDHRIEGQYRFSVHDVSMVALQDDNGGGCAAAPMSGAFTPPSAASPAPAAHPEASVEEQREHDEAEAADALLGVAGPLSGEVAGGVLLSDDAGGAHGIKRPHSTLATWHPGDVEGHPEPARVAKVGRGGRGGRGGASGRGGRASAPLPASEHPARRATPPQAPPVAGVSVGVGAWDAHALNVQLSQLRADVWHMNRELSGQLVSLRDEMRAQTDAVLHCLERLCFQFFSAGGSQTTPTLETPILPTTVPPDEVTALRTEVLKLRALLPVEGQLSPTGVPTPGALPADEDLSVDRATAADRLARSVHLPLQRPMLLPPGPPPQWSPFALPARASPAVDAAGVSRAVRVAAGDGPLLPPRPAMGQNPAEVGPAPAAAPQAHT